MKHLLSNTFGRLYCSFKGVQFGNALKVYGKPLIRKHKEAVIELGEHVVLTSSSRVNIAGINHPVILGAIAKGSFIRFGHHSGMSGGVIIAAKGITIGNYVNIGVNVSIYDNDFHHSDLQKRRENVSVNESAKEIVIEDDVWIGANVTILKGVTIGKGAIIGAGSIVTKDVPEMSVWAGNPAQCIKTSKV